MEKNKGMNLLQKLYRCRLRIDRNGTTIVNLSSLFCLPCLLFAPHMSIAGLVVSLILGYHISLETEGDSAVLEEAVRSAAETVKRTAASAAKTIRQEIVKSHTETISPGKQEPVPANTEPVSEPASSNEEIVEELKAHMDADIPHGNPATYHTAFTAAAGSVPTLNVQSEDPNAENPSLPKMHYQQ